MAIEHSNVWVAYAAPDQQFLIAVPFQSGMTAEQAIELSQIRQHVLVTADTPIGIFGQKIALDTGLQIGDRVEIYRPLTINPKDIRRHRAKKNPVGRLKIRNQMKSSDS